MAKNPYGKGYRDSDLLDWAETEVQTITAAALGWWITFADADGVMPEDGREYQCESLREALAKAKADQEAMIASADKQRKADLQKGVA